MAKPTGLSVGRIVHYVMEDGEHRPAIIVRVWQSGPCDGYVNMTVFPDWSNDAGSPGMLWKTSICYDEDQHKPNTWHYPERVE